MLTLSLITAAQDDLRSTLRSMLESGTDANPALAALLSDYTRYHQVLVVVGGLFLVAATGLSAVLWKRWRRSRAESSPRSRFERRAYFWSALLLTGVSLFLALVVAANISNVLDPRHGFGGALGLIGTPKASTSAGELHAAYTTWLTSGTDEVPSRVTEAIDDRLAWQRPKAIITSVLMVGFVALAAVTWRSLIRRSRVRSGRRPLGEWTLLGLGLLSGAACLLLMLMVIGNTQGSIAPLSLTLFYG
jgi:uncharacterized membrane protein YidH (DUF202 family)